MEKLWKILVVDDQSSNLEVLRGILSDTYALAFAKDGEAALAAAQRHHPDLILLDIMMPGLDGYEVCRRLKADPQLHHIPVIFVTALTELEDEAKGFQVGAVDYVTKPVSAAIVRARVRTHISLISQEIVLDRLGVAGEFRDNDTGSHVRRMGQYAEILARRYGWDNDACRVIAQTAPMHDIGKIAISDNILLKPGKLSEEEWQVMRTHPVCGSTIVGDHNSSLMQMAARIAISHHEKWDGSGYPYHLSGEQIPIEGRIVAIADVYDALMSRRPYKEAWAQDDVISHIREQSGKHFDPALVKIFLESVDDFIKIRNAIPD